MPIARLLLTCLAALLLLVPAGQVSAEDGWYWLSSDDKYSKYVDLSSIVTEESVQTPKGKVPVIIDAWTKTSYSYEGAKETIAAYGLTAKIPNPANFAYSLAQVRVRPQTRTIQYLREEFYDQKNKLLWSKNVGREKEINSQQFDEEFYDAVVDHVFRMGEMKRRTAKDRWLTLWEDRTAEGQSTYVTADTTTMRMKGNNLILWEWQETKDADGNVLEIKFMKKAVNLPISTERVINLQYWTRDTGWQRQEEPGDDYRVPMNGAAYNGMNVLRQYVRKYPAWVNRYNLEGK